jgi:hypothetical protein
VIAQFLPGLDQKKNPDAQVEAVQQHVKRESKGAESRGQQR